MCVSFQFVSVVLYSLEPVMGNVDATIQTRRLRRELVRDGADPYWVAAEALQTVERLKRLLAEYQKTYR